LGQGTLPKFVPIQSSFCRLTFSEFGQRVRALRIPEQEGDQILLFRARFLAGTASRFETTFL
jgi:hypothetical protein